MKFFIQYLDTLGFIVLKNEASNLKTEFMVNFQSFIAPQLTER